MALRKANNNNLNLSGTFLSIRKLNSNGLMDAILSKNAAGGTGMPKNALATFFKKSVLCLSIRKLNSNGLMDAILRKNAAGGTGMPKNVFAAFFKFVPLKLHAPKINHICLRFAYNGKKTNVF